MDISHDDLEFFLSLWETRSITQTARDLNLTLPTASRRMARLREIFGDPCFVRSHQGLIPTDFTIESIGEIIQLYRKLHDLTQRKTFEPSELNRVIRIAIPDNAIPFLLPNVVKSITDQAPHCSIAFLHSSPASFEDLQKGYIDFLINPKILVPRGNHFMPLHAFDQIILVRKKHPLVEMYKQKGTIDADDLKHFDRILVNDSYAATQNNDIYLSNYDRYFMSDNVQRTRIVVPYFIGAQYFLESTDLTLSLPKETALKIAERNPYLTTLPSPLAKSGAIVPCLFWHERTHHDPAMQWIRAQFKAFAQTEEGAREEQSDNF